MTVMFQVAIEGPNITIKKCCSITEDVQKLNTNLEFFKPDFSATRIEINSLNERLIALEMPSIQDENILKLLTFPPQ